MRGAGVHVETIGVRDAPVSGADISVVQHEWSLFAGDDDLRDVIRALPPPVVLFAHTPGVERFASDVAAFISLAPNAVTTTARPVCVVPHPALVPDRLDDRASLRARFGLPANTTVIGSSGFLLPHRGFDEVLELLLPRAAEHGWFVDLVASPWTKEIPGVRSRLVALAAEFGPRVFRAAFEFRANDELNRQLQACDLLWCWTKMPSLPYGSGSISDQYASGTRLVAAEKEQHAHVLALPNVVRAPADLDAFVDALAAEADRSDFPRHDPSLVSWQRTAPKVLEFLAKIAGAAGRAA